MAALVAKNVLYLRIIMNIILLCMGMKEEGSDMYFKQDDNINIVCKV